MRVAIAKGSSARASAQKLGDYLDEWLSAVEPRLRETTAASYRVSVERIKGGLGAVKLSEFRHLTKGARTITAYCGEAWAASGAFGSGGVEKVLSDSTGWHEVSGSAWL